MSEAADPARPGPALRARLRQLLDSYERLAGEPLSELEALFDAPFAVLAHGTERPPVLWYGNRRALSLWKMSFADLTRMPSYRTAEPDARGLREQMLAEVRGQGIFRSTRGCAWPATAAASASKTPAFGTCWMPTATWWGRLPCARAWYTCSARRRWSDQ